MNSIYSEYFAQRPFIDRYQQRPAQAVDVFIPVMHTNELWRANLLSIYREVPVARLLIGDAGCSNDSLEVLRSFPRVVVHDHRTFQSLGYSLRKLIEAVTTEYFIYLHSDVYLPAGWFDTMWAYREKYEWFECPQHLTFLVDYRNPDNPERAYSGSQMGKRSAFNQVLPLIGDDFLYRTEDIVLESLIKRTGGRYGKVGETFHYHQMMVKPSKWERKVTQVSCQVSMGKDEEIRAARMEAHSYVKYYSPDNAPPWIAGRLVDEVKHLEALAAGKPEEFIAWAHQTNPAWDQVLADAFPQPLVTDALFFVQGHAQVGFMLDVISAFRSGHSFAVILGDKGFFGEYEHDARTLLSHTRHCVDETGTSLEWLTKTPRVNEAKSVELTKANADLFSNLMTVLSSNLPPELLQPMRRALHDKIRELQVAYDLIGRFRPKAVVAVEDSVLSGAAPLIKAANDALIPVLLLMPETLWNTRYTAIPPISTEDQWSRFFAGSFPQWTRNFGARPLLRVPPCEIVAAETLGLSPACPWEANTGGHHAKVDLYKVLTDSPTVASALLQSGLIQPQVSVLPSADFAQTAAGELAQSLGRQVHL